MRIIVMRRAVVIGLLAWLFSLDSAAEESRDQATEAFDRGNQLFEAHDYEAALEAFESSYELYPHDRILFNIANCQRALGRYRESSDSFERYLQNRGDDLPRRERQRIEGLIEEMRASLGTLRVVTSPGDSEVLVDGRSIEFQGTLPIRSGGHTITIVSTGYEPEIRQINVTEGEETVINVVLVPVGLGSSPSSPPPLQPPTGGETSDRENPDTPGSTEPRPIYRRWWFWTVIGAVVAGAAVGAGFGAASFHGAEGGDWDLRLP